MACGQRGESWSSPRTRRMQAGAITVARSSAIQREGGETDEIKCPEPNAAENHSPHDAIVGVDAFAGDPEDDGARREKNPEDPDRVQPGAYYGVGALVQSGEEHCAKEAEHGADSARETEGGSVDAAPLQV